MLSCTVAPFINSFMLISVNSMFQCSTGEEYLPFTALCNGTNECSSGAVETNVFCASEYKHTIVLNIHCLLLAQTSAYYLTTETAHTTWSALHKKYYGDRCGNCLPGFFPFDGSCEGIILISMYLYLSR